MKTILVNIPPQNLQLQHKMHHKLRHQQTTTLLEFELELLVQDQIHMIHNHFQILLPSTFKSPNKTIRSEDKNNQQTSSQYYDSFIYSSYTPANTNIQTNNNQKTSQPNNNPNLLTHHSHTRPLSTNSTKETLLHKLKGYHILTLYNFLKDDSEILHFRIYQPTPYIN